MSGIEVKTQEKDTTEHLFGVIRALAEISQSHIAYCDQHVGVSQHSHDLARIADRALGELPFSLVEMACG